MLLIIIKLTIMHLFILHVLRHHNDMSTKKCQSFTDANNLIILTELMTFISGKLILESLISDDLTQNTSPNDLFSLVNYKISVLALNIASKIADT